MAAAATALPFDPAQLVNFAEPWDANRVHMLDHMVTLMYSNQAHRELANQVLTQVRDHPDSWHVVDTVLATSQSADTKFFALQLLEAVISTRWRVLPAEQRAGIKNYVVQLVIKISSDEQFVVTQKHFLVKLNQTLIQIVKKEWPDAWENFIPDICGASRTSQSLCENNLRILNLLSEEVFTFGRSHMTSKKVAGLKESLNAQFATIYGLCDFVFKTHIQSPGSIKAPLLQTTLSTLARFLEWIPVNFIFETDLIQTLLVHFWDPLDYRIECVKCLNEIACLHEGVQQYQPQLLRLFQGVVEKIQQLPNVEENYASMNGVQRQFWEVFHNQIALLLIGFLHNNMAVMEAQHAYMNHAIVYLARITTMPNEETFKICVEFWQTFSARLYLEAHEMRAAAAAARANQQRTSPLMLDPAGRPPQPAADPYRDKLQRYRPVLNDVCRVLIDKMAKPQEVTIKENEEGHIVRAEEEDTDELALYRLMREALVYFTNLMPLDMESIMTEILTKECLSEGTAIHWTPTLLNRLCWAIGSISGAMQESDEKRFVVAVIKDLLSLCEMKRGKDAKGVVAANMMYVVGQYSRFLKAHWKFMKVVIVKLFEFMRETVPGIQEMAVETFLKICQKCKKKLVIQQKDEPPFVETMLPTMQQAISELEHLHLCTFFEAMGHMVSAASPAENRERLVGLIMGMWNQKWVQLLHQISAAGEHQFSSQHQVLREISLVLRVNERMVSAAGASCHRQLELIYFDMLKIYKVCSDFISAGTAQQGTQIMGHTPVKLMRNVKRDTLRLVQTFVDVAAGDGATVTAEVLEEKLQETQRGRRVLLLSEFLMTQRQRAGLSPQQIAQKFVPPLLEPVLADYRSNLPQARDAEVLDLLATLATRLSEPISQEVTKIFEMVFECTLDMIKGDFQSFPDHRSKFYNLLKAINAHCFQSLFSLSEAQLKLYVDSLIWAMKHEQPAVADMGLQILEKFLARVLAGHPQVRASFFAQYYFTLTQDVLVVLTDTLHKAGFKQQQAILLQLISTADSGMINEVAPKQQVMEYLFGVIHKAFPILHRSQVEIFVLHCFNKCRNPAEFQQHIRDFLIEMREWGSNEDAYYESGRTEARTQAQAADIQFRLQVPGLVPQYDPARTAIEADMDDI